jgi:ABC-type transporter Mla maintaining outer membrane lipid asymmetry ATPase subunit MlaF
VLNHCSTEVAKGEVVVVCGPSGSGKSTLIKCVNGGGTLPALFGLSRTQLPAAMDMLSGEGVSGTQETALGAAGMFTSIMMDQGAFWRNGETVDINGVAFEALQYACVYRKPRPY